MTAFDDFLNFFMPIAVFAFIAFVFYRIPLVGKGVDLLIEKIRGWREGRDNMNEENESFYNTIQYE